MIVVVKKALSRELVTKSDTWGRSCLNDVCFLSKNTKMNGDCLPSSAVKVSSSGTKECESSEDLS